MKIAFVRGAHLNPWEVQSYRAVAEKHEIQLIGAHWGLHPEVREPSMRVLKLPCTGDLFSRSSIQCAVRANRMSSVLTGSSYVLSGLERALVGCDIVHSAESYFTMSWQCNQLRKTLGYKLVLTVWENLPGLGQRHPLRRARKQEVLKQVDAFLAVTEPSRQMLISEGVPTEKIAVIPMGIDTERFRPSEKDKESMAMYGIHPEEFVILYIGRLVEEKGVVELSEAVRYLQQRYPKRRIRCLFVGDGPLQSRILQWQAESPHLFTWIPFVDYTQLPRLHTLADVFVLPSKPSKLWTEQFGYVLIESMASQKAIVSTTSGSIPDVVSDAGLLVEPGDSTALTEGLARLLKDDALRAELALKGRIRAESTFSLNVVGQRIERFYENVLSSRAVNHG